jgi:alkyldihydroxyacetonephosphate synthase
VSTETIKVGDKTIPEVFDNHPNRGTKLDYINKQGWGYDDSGFYLDKKVNQIRIKGNRYMFGG